MHIFRLHPGLRLYFMQFVHNFIQFAWFQNVSSKRAMRVQPLKTVLGQQIAAAMMLLGWGTLAVPAGIVNA